MFFKRLPALIMGCVVLAASSFSCSKKGSTNDTPVVADFTFSGAGFPPSIVSFSNRSSGAVDYRWDFGDNSTSTSSNPSHTYTTAGTYTVRLTATGTGGASSTTSKSLAIAAPTSVKIIGIKVQSIPFTTTNGNSWDILPSSGPDLYPVLGDFSNNVLYSHGTYTPDVTASMLPLSYAFAPAFQINNFGTTYKVWLYDRDQTAPNDEYVGGYSFNMNAAAAAGYPSSFTLFTTGSSTRVDLILQWQ
ncbi:PKD domain-containing protein [Flaviaesturariibacter amylovorans]|uniref:PKD domain-containing protein n=1 Tax=Flaviaesturariibacter amylovorans TaxID=1084520 RepID=A0ABP8H555_9BACT